MLAIAKSYEFFQKVRSPHILFLVFSTDLKTDSRNQTFSINATRGFDEKNSRGRRPVWKCQPRKCSWATEIDTRLFHSTLGGDLRKCWHFQCGVFRKHWICGWRKSSGKASFEMFRKENCHHSTYSGRWTVGVIHCSFEFFLESLHFLSEFRNLARWPPGRAAPSVDDLKHYCWWVPKSFTGGLNRGF